MNSEPVINSIQAYLHEMLPEMGLELFDIDFRQEGRGWVLRIFIDTIDHSDNNGVNLEQCSSVSRELGDYLDVEDTIPYAYTLEVSSPGLERRLRSAEDFAHYIGKMCKIRLHHPIDNQKVYVGEIAVVEGEEITLQLEKKKLVIHWDMLSKARLFFK